MSVRAGICACKVHLGETPGRPGRLNQRLMAAVISARVRPASHTNSLRRSNIPRSVVNANAVKVPPLNHSGDHQRVLKSSAFENMRAIFKIRKLFIYKNTLNCVLNKIAA